MRTATRTLILRELETGDKTKHDLAAAIRVTSRTIQRAVNDLWEEDAIHIGAYMHTHGDYTPLWRLGKGRNASRPK